MIVAKGTEVHYSTPFSNGTFEAFSDTTPEKGGQGAGFRPHELLEAALACCINMWLRTYANHHKLPLEETVTTVWVNRDKPGETIFEYKIELQGALTEEQRSKLLQTAETCPVHRTLSQKLSFQAVPSTDDD